MDANPSRRHPPEPRQPYRFVRGRWPARSRRLIEELHELVGDWLRAPLQRTLDDFAQHLFELAEHARNGIDQQAYMNSREKLLQGRQHVESRFIDGIGQALDRIGEREQPDTAEFAAQPLSLVNPAEQEMTAALEKVAARGVARGGPPLFELGFRLAVLVACAPLEGAAQPIGPHAVARAFRDAAAELDLPDEHDLQLLASFDRVLVRDIAALYEVLNRHLLADGILPQLRAYPTAAPAARPATTPPARAEAEATAADSASDAPPRSRGRRASDARPPSEPIAVLDSLREMLAQRRGGRSGSTGGSGPIATAEELQTALGALQQHFSQVTDHATRELRSAQRLREELLAQLNADRPSGSAHARLSGEQNDTVELVAMLFEQLGKQVHKGGNARSMLGGLQLPMLRMAVGDQSFFEQREHPARRLLGTVTEAANDWLDNPGGEPDRGLEVKLEQLIERASREPPSAGLYTSLLADIEQHLNVLKLRAQATERRHVEAMQGRERLEQARQRATELMAERFAASPPRGLLRALLDRAWTDVLALSLLRHGENDPACAAQIAITDQLLGLVPVTDRTQLQLDVQQGLRQIGMAVEEAIQVAQRLVAPDDADTTAVMADDDQPSATEMMVRLKQRQRLGEPSPRVTPPTGARDAAATPAPDATADAPAAAADDANPAAPVADDTAATAPAQPARQDIAAPSADARTASIQQGLLKLPFGTWFDFVDATSGHVSQRKLAWYSPMSGQALFVTRRGQRGDEMSLAELARRIGAGQVRQTPATGENMLDRAWRGFTGNLRRAAGKPQAAPRT